MKSKISALAFALVASCGSLHAQGVLLSDLGWLAGHWIGTSEGGVVYESHYSDPTGGLIVSAHKELRNGRAVSADFEMFFVKDGRIIFHPSPNGRKSEHSFPLAGYDALARRAVFENRDNDFPQVFIFEQPATDALRITLEGPGKDGEVKRIVFEMRRTGPNLFVHKRVSSTGVDGKARRQSAFAIYEVREELIRRVWYFPSEDESKR